MALTDLEWGIVILLVLFCIVLLWKYGSSESLSSDVALPIPVVMAMGKKKKLVAMHSKDEDGNHQVSHKIVHKHVRPSAEQAMRSTADMEDLLFADKVLPSAVSRTDFVEPGQLAGSAPGEFYDEQQLEGSSGVFVDLDTGKKYTKTSDILGTRWHEVQPEGMHEQQTRPVLPGKASRFKPKTGVKNDRAIIVQYKQNVEETVNSARSTSMAKS